MKRLWPDQLYAVLPFVLLAAFFLNGLNDATHNSAVADEVGGHTSSGYLYWSSGRYSGGIANFALPHLLSALPVKLLGYEYELFSEQHLVAFRLSGLLMGALLGIALYRFALGLFDRKTALAALFLFSLSPNVLAHASLATLDLPIAFFAFLTIYALWRYVRRPGATRMLAVSLALAAALTTKVQGFLLIPLVVAVLLVHTRRLRSAPAGSVSWWSWLFLPLVPWLFINVVYLNFPLRPGHLVPSLYTAALKLKLTHGLGSLETGQIAYLCGRYSQDGWWYYFPFAILVKTPVPTLILLTLGLVRKHTRESLLFLVLPAVAFLGATMTAKLNIGLRHILIIYPFLFMIAGRGAARLWDRSWRGAILAVLVAWYFWQAITVAPHHISYFNTLAGGPRNGHKLLIGSNFDFGQDDRFLRRYVRDRGIAYQINPDPFRPTTGHVLVKANAFYGNYGAGGPDGYAWLKPFRRVNQIAYTWFEYDIPDEAFAGQAPGEWRIPPYIGRSLFRPWKPDVDPDSLDAALDEITLHLLRLRNRYAEIIEPEFSMPLGFAFVATASYADVLDEMRLLLERYPDFEPALGLGGEVMVRWKVGSLRFKDDQYLTGFEKKSREPGGIPVDLESVTQAASLAGITAPVSNVYYRLGTVLERRDRLPEAAQAYRSAVRIEPACAPARTRLDALQAALPKP